MGVKLTAEQKADIINQYKSGDKEGALATAKSINSGTTPTTPTPTTKTTTTPAQTTQTAQTTPTTYTNKSEYGGQGGIANQKTVPQDNPYVNQGNGQYNYDNKSGYYVSNQPTSSSNADSIRSKWESMSYEDQQKALKNMPNLQSALEKYGITNKQQNTQTQFKQSPREDQGDGKYEYNDKTGYYERVDGKGDGWDYQDNSPERMAQILDNLNNLSKTNPGLFANYDAFYNAFIAGKGRSPEQEALLNDYFNNMKKYNQYDNMSSDAIGQGLVNGTVSEDYLNYVKYADPQRYAEIQEARKRGEDTIKSNAFMDTINSINDGADYTSQTSKVIEWLKGQGLLVDKDGNLIDDRIENYANDEELGYQKQIADLNARNLEIDMTMKNTYDDYREKYPGATKAELMAMAQDTNNDLLREKEDNLVQLTRLQGYVGYMQSERQERNRIGENAINQLQKQYGMYYDYTAEGMSELAQAKYAATNVTLDQADNGTDTQKQMALDQVLTDIYDKYGSIIQRSKSQVINDVMALAKKEGISLSDALEKDFLSQLRKKPEYETLSSGGGTTSYKRGSYEGADGKKHFVRTNEATGEMVEMGLGDIIGDMGDLSGLTSSNRDTRKQALFNLAQQASSPEEQAQLIAAAMEGNYAGTCGAYANDINYAITGDKTLIFWNDVKQKEGVCDNTEWDNIKAGDFVVFNYQNIPGVSRNVVPSRLQGTDLETWQDMYDHGHVGYVTDVGGGNITMTHTKGKIATNSTFNKNTKLGQALYGSYSPVGGYDKNIPSSVYKMVGKAIDGNDFKTLDEIAKKYNYSDTNQIINQYEKQYQSSIIPVSEGLLQKIDQLIDATKNTSKAERALTFQGEGSYMNSAGYSAYQSLHDDYALDKLQTMTVKLSPMSDTDVQIVAKSASPFMANGYMYDNNDYFMALQNLRDSILSRSEYLQKKYGHKNSWTGKEQYYDAANYRFSDTKPRGVLGGND